VISAPRPLTLKEVAGRLRISKRTVERLIERGRLRAVRVSPRRRIVTPEDLGAFLAGEKCDRTRQDATPQLRRLTDAARRG
jgi:excisionase family DNA binding protein